MLFRSKLFRSSFEILARLYHQEKAWDRKHWGGRPDTRGPYYEMVTWKQSDRILKALRGASWKIPKDEVGEYLSLLGSNRIQDNETLNSLIESTKYDPTLIPVLSAQLSSLNDPPANGLDVLATAPEKNKTLKNLYLQGNGQKRSAYPCATITSSAVSSPIQTVL